MAFRQIGTLASAVLLKAELAAAAHNAQRKGGDGPMSQGEGEPLSPSPIAQRPGGAARANEKKHGATVPAGVVGHFEPSRANPPILSVVQGNRCIGTAKPHAVRPRAVVPIHLVLIVNNAHDTGPKWGMR